MFGRATLPVQAKRFGGAQANEDFGEPSAVNVVAGGTVTGKAMKIAAKSISYAIVCFPLIAAADELPSELLLRCDLKQTVYMTSTGRRPDLVETKLSKDFRLKDGTFYWTGLRVPIGNDCKLVDGDIACAWSGLIPPSGDSPLGARTEKRQSSVRLSRATGEIRLVLETWGYAGDGIKGTPDGAMKMTQSGVCRTIGKALF